MNESNDTAVVVVGTSAVGLAIAFVRGLFSRAVQKADDDNKRQDDEIEKLKTLVQAQERLLVRLEGIVSAESWGLQAVVAKLNTNVEHLTAAVHTLNAKGGHS